MFVRLISVRFTKPKKVRRGFETKCWFDTFSYGLCQTFKILKLTLHNELRIDMVSSFILFGLKRTRLPPFYTFDHALLFNVVIVEITRKRTFIASAGTVEYIK